MRYWSGRCTVSRKCPGSRIEATGRKPPIWGSPIPVARTTLEAIGASVNALEPPRENRACPPDGAARTPRQASCSILPAPQAQPHQSVRLGQWSQVCADGRARANARNGVTDRQGTTAPATLPCEGTETIPVSRRCCAQPDASMRSLRCNVTAAPPRIVAGWTRPPTAANVSWPRRRASLRTQCRIFPKKIWAIVAGGEIRISGCRACQGRSVLAADVEVEVRAFDDAASQRSSSSCRSVPNQEMPLSLAFATIEARSADLH
jgi:hypothetical protein